MFVASAHFYGQITPEQNTPEKNPVHAQSEAGTYILKDIVVDGVKKYTPAQILRFTGLNKNESVEIPGQKISNAIKKLWETQSFSEVEVYIQSIEGDQIVLRFNLQDLKDLGEVKFTGKGIGKSKSEKLAKDNGLKPGTKITQNLISTLKTNIPKEYVKKAKKKLKIEVETRNLAEVEEALKSGVDRIMLDNMDTLNMKKAVQLINGKCESEASGGVTRDRLQEIANTGVDFISAGALTHSAGNIDLSLKAVKNLQ